jgi:uncharacterized protein
VSRTKLRAVVDTNIFISGFLFGGTGGARLRAGTEAIEASSGGAPRAVIDLALERRFEIAISDDLIQELAEVLERPKFRVKNPHPSLILSQLQEICIKVNPRRDSRFQLKDKDDHIVLDCAIASGASCIVTGDAEFLAHGNLAGIPVITAPKFLESFAGAWL